MAAADAAGQVIRPLFRSALLVEAKGDASPVTEADKGAERAMRALLSARFPERRATALSIHGMGATLSDTLTPLAVGSLVYQGVIVAFASYLVWFWLLTRYYAARLAVFSFLGLRFVYAVAATSTYTLIATHTWVFTALGEVP